MLSPSPPPICSHTLCAPSPILNPPSTSCQIEFSVVGLFNGLIFALPSFRNSMPLAPPFGSLTDWISFFWAEGFAVLGLCILAIKYVNPILT